MSSSALAFDHDEMVPLFEAGAVLGRRADAWGHEPATTPEVSEAIIGAMKQFPPLLVE